MTLPQTAIVYNPTATSFTGRRVPTARKGPSRRVGVFGTVGPARGDQVAIRSGVKPGEAMITAGQIKFRNGSMVKINNSIQPLADSNPLPLDR